MISNNTRVLAILILAACLGAAYWLFIRPGLELDEVAQDTCDQMDGAIMLQVGPILNSAQRKAERLGFTPPELGDRMRAKCPDLMSQLNAWAEEHR